VSNDSFSGEKDGVLVELRQYDNVSAELKELADNNNTVKRIAMSPKTSQWLSQV
jgi:hypothetical protein